MPSHPIENYAGIYTHPAYGDVEIGRGARRERGPAVGEPTNVIGIGRFEAADAEWAPVAREVRAGLAVTDDVDPLAGKRVEAQLAVGRVGGIARHAAILAGCGR